MDEEIKKINGFYYQEHDYNINLNGDFNKLLSLYNKGLLNKIVQGQILYNIDNIFNDYKKKLRSIKRIKINHENFSNLLKNYMDNYYSIKNFLTFILNKSISEKEKKICNDIIYSIDDIMIKSASLFLYDTNIYFKDAKYIIESIYDDIIKEFKDDIESQFIGGSIYKNKYIKYKNKYVQLKLDLEKN